MKTSRLTTRGSVAFALWCACSLSGCATGGRNYLSDLGVRVPASAITSDENEAGLTSDEHYLILKLTPAQFSAMLARFKSYPEFELLPPGEKTRTPLTPPTKVDKLFAPAPASARYGTFVVEHDKGTENHWSSWCEFAFDKTTGRVWFCAVDGYN